MFGFGIVNRPEETQNDVDESLVEKHKWAALVLLNPIFCFFGGEFIFPSIRFKPGMAGYEARTQPLCHVPPGL